MELNNSAVDMVLKNKTAVELDLEELKLNIDNMFLVINGIIVSCEYNIIYGLILHVHYSECSYTVDDDFIKHFFVRYG